MNLLAIDTALAACSVGVLAGKRPPVVLSEAIGRGHAERLPPMVAEAVSAAGLAFTNLDRIAVTTGPGSFTGVRIGIAFARGLALVTGAETVGVGVLAVLAARARELAGAVPVLAVLDARRGEVYAQHFAADGTVMDAPHVATAAGLATVLASDMLLAGSGADAIAAELGEGADRRIVHRAACADIATLLDLARRSLADIAPVRPLYLRAPDAKPQVAASLARR